METDRILILDFGGQYSQLIARRVREQQVYAEIASGSRSDAEKIRKEGYKGIILTGGPNSVYDPASPKCSVDILKTGIPVLGICYGFQLMAYLSGGTISSAESSSEYGRTSVETLCGGKLLEGVPDESTVWMSHTDFVKEVPEGFSVTAHTDKCPCAAFEMPERGLYGVQFHPEVNHTEYGTDILRNFLFAICGCEGNWKMEDFLERSVEKYRKELADEKVLLALSGGVDSAVAAVLLHKAVGRNLICVFVDHGMLRKDEGDRVEKVFKDTFGMNLIRVNAKDRFLKELEGVTDPETKRKIIGSGFVKVFEEEALRAGSPKILAQGTIYPDVIESGLGDSAVIKSHHNVGGLPETMSFKKVVEPLKYLFKDEVRKLGLALGIPRELVFRQPFPGPGLAVRIIGEITEEKLNILKEADAVFREEVEKAEIPEPANQYFAVLTGIRTVGVMGDMRTYGYTIALRAVTTDDFMTASWTRLPYEVLGQAATRITNEVKGVSRVVYDITSKPPSTVEWE